MRSARTDALYHQRCHRRNLSCRMSVAQALELSESLVFIACIACEPQVNGSACRRIAKASAAAMTLPLSSMPRSNEGPGNHPIQRLGPAPERRAGELQAMVPGSNQSGRAIVVRGRRQYKLPHPTCTAKGGR